MVDTVFLSGAVLKRIMKPLQFASGMARSIGVCGGVGMNLSAQKRGALMPFWGFAFSTLLTFANNSINPYTWGVQPTHKWVWYVDSIDDFTTSAGANIKGKIRDTVTISGHSCIKSTASALPSSYPTNMAIGNAVAFRMFDQ